MPRYFKLAVWIFFYLAVSFGIGQITQGEIQGWYQNLQKPSFNPPNWIFPIMWSILYVMIATTGWKLWQDGAAKLYKNIFILYTLLNWAWTPIFFGAHQIGIGLVWIIGINLVNLYFIVKVWQPHRLCGVLMIPPLVWTGFASILTYYIWMMNS